MTVYTSDFISLITGSVPPLHGCFVHMELIRILRLVNARIVQLESSF